MALRYCFEQSYVLRTLNALRKNDLAVIDTDGISTAAIISSISLLSPKWHQKILILDAI